MARKKVRRFLTGGETDEAADKAAGLEASKGEDVGFFERLRMGNIDDPSSEAYRRFGAGRGRASRVPVEEAKAIPVAEIKAQAAKEAAQTAQASPPASSQASYDPEYIDTSVKETDRTPKQSFGAAFKAARGAGDKEFTWQGKRYTTQTKEEAQKAKAASAAKETDRRPKQSYFTTDDEYAHPRNASYFTTDDEYAHPTVKESKTALSLKDRIAQIPSGSDKAPIEGQRVEPYSEFGSNVANNLAALGPARLAGIGAIGMEMMGAKALRQAEAARMARSQKLAEELRRSQPGTKFSSTSKKPSKVTKKFNDEEANVEFKRGGKVKKMAFGGSISKASKRADGIAQRGKTRGRYI
jgi:hypothetical protein